MLRGAARGNAHADLDTDIDTPRACTRARRWRARHWVSIAVLVLLGVVWGVQAWRRAHRADGNDFTTYMIAARAIAAGESPYAIASRFPYVYPPFLAGALVPLIALPYGVAVVSWLVVNAAALWWMLAWLRRQVCEACDALPIAAAVLIVAAPVLQSNVVNGQVNFLVLAACTAALAASGTLRARPRHSRESPMLRLQMMRDGGGTLARRARLGAALLWAAAIATKLVPLVLVPFWIARRQLTIVGAGLSIAFVLSAGLLQGPAATMWTGLYVREFVVRALADGAFASGDGADTNAADLDGAPLVDGLLHDGSKPILRFSFLSALETLLPSTLEVPGLPFLAALLVVAIVTTIDRRRGHRPDVDLHAFALYLLAIPLASPKSEAHHLAAALPAAFLNALVEHRSSLRPSSWRRRTLVAAAVCFWIGATTNAAKNVCWFATLVLLAIVSASLVMERRSGDDDRES